MRSIFTASLLTGVSSLRASLWRRASVRRTSRVDRRQCDSDLCERAGLHRHAAVHGNGSQRQGQPRRTLVALGLGMQRKPLRVPVVGVQLVGRADHLYRPGGGEPSQSVFDPATGTFNSIPSSQAANGSGSPGPNAIGVIERRRQRHRLGLGEQPVLRVRAARMPPAVLYAYDATDLRTEL